MLVNKNIEIGCSLSGSKYSSQSVAMDFDLDSA